MKRRKTGKKKHKEHYEKKKKNQNVLYVMLGAVVGRAHPKICNTSIYQTWSADYKRP